MAPSDLVIATLYNRDAQFIAHQADFPALPRIGERIRVKGRLFVVLEITWDLDSESNYAPTLFLGLAA